MGTFLAAGAAFGAMWSELVVNEPAWATTWWLGVGTGLCFALAAFFGLVGFRQWFRVDPILEWEILRGASIVKHHRPDRHTFLHLDPLRLLLHNPSAHDLRITDVGLTLHRGRGFLPSRQQRLTRWGTVDFQRLSEAGKPDGHRIHGAIALPPESRSLWDVHVLMKHPPEWEQQLREEQDRLAISVQTDDKEEQPQLLSIRWDRLWGAPQHDGITLDPTVEAPRHPPDPPALRPPVHGVQTLEVVFEKGGGFVQLDALRAVRFVRVGVKNHGTMRIDAASLRLEHQEPYNYFAPIELSRRQDLGPEGVGTAPSFPINPGDTELVDVAMKREGPGHEIVLRYARRHPNGLLPGSYVLTLRAVGGPEGPSAPRRFRLFVNDDHQLCLEPLETEGHA